MTLAASGLFVLDSAGTSLAAAANGRARLALEVAAFGAIAGCLIYGNLAYQLSRLGFLLRLTVHRPLPPSAHDERLDRPPVPLAILVPSYQEEPRVIRQALISAALQPHPGRRVVLLIDDRPDPQSEHAEALLTAARRLVRELDASFAGAARRAGVAAGEATALLAVPGVRHRRAAALRLAAAYDEAGAFLDGLADAAPAIDHTDELFGERVLRRPAAAHRARARLLRRLALRVTGPPPARLGRAARRLAPLFDVPICSFERKRYANLSHEPNKAMNLNSYIGLLGGRWREVRGDEGVQLLRAPAGEDAELEVADAEYVLTLDADSLLMPEYVPSLMAVMEGPGNERVAVAQTPYSAVPGASSALERVAGATTDIQYVIHQGFTYHAATFWVGANALIRKRALEDIAVDDVERGLVVRRYIQDRTVIEDTESSVDLVRRDWQLLNYPERLSFSATPPDFGSLIIQRRRWANGGLIILPKLLAHFAERLRRRRPSLTEAFLRSHYLISIAATNIALLVLLGYPFRDSVASAWLPVAAVPYLILYARDLRQSGYTARDLVRVYALNLLLLPVNLGGVAKSVQQATTGRKIPFGRTPKVEGRTAAPALYLLAPLALASLWAVASLGDALSGRVVHAAFAGTNAVLLIYAIWRFVGARDLAGDLRAQLGWRLAGNGSRRPLGVR